jgi:hypothetical protein
MNYKVKIKCLDCLFSGDLKEQSRMLGGLDHLMALGFPSCLLGKVYLIPFKYY